MKTQEKRYKKHVWIVFILIGTLIVIGGIPHMMGVNTDPDLVEAIGGQSIQSLKSNTPQHFNLYNFYFRSGGLSDIGVGCFLIIIAAFAYRKGEKWAWFALWFVPAFFMNYIVLSLSLPEEGQAIMLPPLVILTIISLLGLLLPYRLFFEKKV